MALRSFLPLAFLVVPACASAPPPAPARPRPSTPVAAVEPARRPVPAGTLRREDVLTVLSDGPPAFLSRVDVEPVRDRGGRFHGWRVVALRDELLASSDVHPGDVITTVNGHPVEDPYQFFDVFQSLAFAKELRVAVERDGAAQELRYPIDDDPTAKPVPRAEPRPSKPPPAPPSVPARKIVRIGGSDE